MKLDVLGVTYTIEKHKYGEDPAFTGGIAGYCDSQTKRIVYGDLGTFPAFAKESAQWWRKTEQETIRHEVVHAFLNECGLRENAIVYTEAWPCNEEMVDWIALMGERIYKAWKKIGAVEEEACQRKHYTK